ncbi:TPA: hypothetical protein ACJGIO_000357, partial [Salmonella enterica subsp. salamae serovar 42:z29:-]
WSTLPGEKVRTKGGIYSLKKGRPAGLISMNEKAQNHFLYLKLTKCYIHRHGQLRLAVWSILYFLSQQESKNDNP